MTEVFKVAGIFFELLAALVIFGGPDALFRIVDRFYGLLTFRVFLDSLERLAVLVVDGELSLVGEAVVRLQVFLLGVRGTRLQQEVVFGVLAEEFD